MPEKQDWEARESAARARLGALDFLLGDWEGQGLAHGGALRGRLSARRILGGTFVESREQLFTPDGQLDHEDLALYRHEPDGDLILVTHLQAPGWQVENRVLGLDEGPGIAWDAGPVEARVEIRPEPDGSLEVAVLFPFHPEPVVRMVYRRVDG